MSTHRAFLSLHTYTLHICADTHVGAPSNFLEMPWFSGITHCCFTSLTADHESSFPETSCRYNKPALRAFSHSVQSSQAMPSSVPSNFHTRLVHLYSRSFLNYALYLSETLQTFVFHVITQICLTPTLRLTYPTWLIHTCSIDTSTPKHHNCVFPFSSNPTFASILGWAEKKSENWLRWVVFHWCDIKKQYCRYFSSFYQDLDKAHLDWK